MPNTLSKDRFALGKALPSAALGELDLAKKNDGEASFAECLISGTWQKKGRETAVWLLAVYLPSVGRKGTQ